MFRKTTYCHNKFMVKCITHTKLVQKKQDLFNFCFSTSSEQAFIPYSNITHTCTILEAELNFSRDQIMHFWPPHQHFYLKRLDHSVNRVLRPIYNLNTSQNRLKKKHKTPWQELDFPREKKNILQLHISLEQVSIPI